MMCIPAYQSSGGPSACLQRAHSRCYCDPTKALAGGPDISYDITVISAAGKVHDVPPAILS